MTRVSRVACDALSRRLRQRLLTLPLRRPKVSLAAAAARETFGRPAWHGRETVPERGRLRPELQQGQSSLRPLE
jgi:hypothetical protein